ncbi:EamA family transporter [Veillonella sp. R32]|uniref:EamA family transporter n=1 Tax=Veillonella sp. R32 TaxID=2021312 RepID=UPI001389F47F|nr:EamA family transporter [Veillonella sp. R32]KAF1682496.1 O-acetylserine/cysteine exporter [Veillonella sp. R32]
MKLRDIVLALSVIVVWGLNFAVIKWGVSELPPLLLVALRYCLAAFPTILFVKRPQVKLSWILAYGLTVGVGQFSCLFYAIHIGMPAGVASVVLQAQAFFTILFTALIFKEHIQLSQLLGLVVAAIGLVFISGAIGAANSTIIPLGSFLLTLLGAAFWGLSNIVVRKISLIAAAENKPLNMLGLVVWSSLIPPIPMLLASLYLEKAQLALLSFDSISGSAMFSVFYLAFLATIMGYGLWSMLLAKYSAHKIAPLSLLVPVVGLLTAQFILGERLALIQWMGGAIIIIGLMITNFGHVFAKRFL